MNNIKKKSRQSSEKGNKREKNEKSDRSGKSAAGREVETSVINLNCETKAKGVYQNHNFMHAATSLVGRIVVITLQSGNQFEGVFKTYSPEFDVALELPRCIKSIKNPENEGKALPNFMIFPAHQVVSLWVRSSSLQNLDVETVKPYFEGLERWSVYKLKVTPEFVCDKSINCQDDESILNQKTEKDETICTTPTWLTIPETTEEQKAVKKLVNWADEVEQYILKTKLSSSVSEANDSSLEDELQIEQLPGSSFKEEQHVAPTQIPNEDKSPLVKEMNKPLIPEEESKVLTRTPSEPFILVKSTHKHKSKLNKPSSVHISGGRENFVGIKDFRGVAWGTKIKRKILQQNKSKSNRSSLCNNNQNDIRPCFQTPLKETSSRDIQNNRFNIHETKKQFNEIVASNDGYSNYITSLKNDRIGHGEAVENKQPSHKSLKNDFFTNQTPRHETLYNWQLHNTLLENESRNDNLKIERKQGHFEQKSSNIQQHLFLNHEYPPLDVLQNESLKKGSLKLEHASEASFFQSSRNRKILKKEESRELNENDHFPQLDLTSEISAPQEFLRPQSLNSSINRKVLQCESNSCESFPNVSLQKGKFQQELKINKSLKQGDYHLRKPTKSSSNERTESESLQKFNEKLSNKNESNQIETFHSERLQSEPNKNDLSDNESLQKDTKLGITCQKKSYKNELLKNESLKQKETFPKTHFQKSKCQNECCIDESPSQKEPLQNATQQFKSFLRESLSQKETCQNLSVQSELLPQMEGLQETHYQNKTFQNEKFSNKSLLKSSIECKILHNNSSGKVSLESDSLLESSPEMIMNQEEPIQSFPKAHLNNQDINEKSLKMQPIQSESYHRDSLQKDHLLEDKSQHETFPKDSNQSNHSNEGVVGKCSLFQKDPKESLREQSSRQESFQTKSFTNESESVWNGSLEKKFDQNNLCPEEDSFKKKSLVKDSIQKESLEKVSLEKESFQNKTIILEFHKKELPSNLTKRKRQSFRNKSCPNDPCTTQSEGPFSHELTQNESSESKISTKDQFFQESSATVNLQTESFSSKCHQSESIENDYHLRKDLLQNDPSIRDLKHYDSMGSIEKESQQKSFLQDHLNYESLPLQDPFSEDLQQNEILYKEPIEGETETSICKNILAFPVALQISQSKLSSLIENQSGKSSPIDEKIYEDLNLMPQLLEQQTSKAIEMPKEKLSSGGNLDDPSEASKSQDNPELETGAIKLSLATTLDQNIVSCSLLQVVQEAIDAKTNAQSNFSTVLSEESGIIPSIESHDEQDNFSRHLSSSPILRNILKQPRVHLPKEENSKQLNNGLSSLPVNEDSIPLNSSRNEITPIEVTTLSTVSVEKDIKKTYSLNPSAKPFTPSTSNVLASNTHISTMPNGQSFLMTNVFPVTNTNVSYNQPPPLMLQGQTANTYEIATGLPFLPPTRRHQSQFRSRRGNNSTIPQPQSFLTTNQMRISGNTSPSSGLYSQPQQQQVFFQAPPTYTMIIPHQGIQYMALIPASNTLMPSSQMTSQIYQTSTGYPIVQQSVGQQQGPQSYQVYCPVLMPPQMTPNQNHQQVTQQSPNK